MYYTHPDHPRFVIKSSFGFLYLSKTVTDLIYKGKGQTFCRKVNTSNVSMGSVFDLSFRKMLTCDTPCPPFLHPLLLTHSSASQTLLPFSLFSPCHCKMQAQRYIKKIKKEENTRHTCCPDFISTLFSPLLPFISENKINEQRTFRAPVLPSPPSSSPYDKGFH